LIAIKRFTTSESGQVTGVWTIQTTKTKNESGAVIFEEIEGSDRYFPVDQVWIANGFSGVEDRILEHLAVASERGKIKRIRYATNRSGVFAAGDARRGQSLNVWAIREGREVAEAVAQYLRTMQQTGKITQSGFSGIFRNPGFFLFGKEICQLKNEY
jgi:glutamate synthase (NADPH/NADH) small chain